MNTDIFKLIFHHDRRLNELAGESSADTSSDKNELLADFMRPDPVYSTFYFSGSDLNRQQFGLSNLSAYCGLITALEQAFSGHHIHTQKTEDAASLSAAIDELEKGQALLLSDKNPTNFDISSLNADAQLSDELDREALHKAIDQNFMVLYKIVAKDGFDLYMFSKKNVYREMFFPLQKLLPDAFRFFSINGKKFKTERHFFFETWALDRPPHGFEEVHPETVLG